jgi:hypothetical protein
MVELLQGVQRVQCAGPREQQRELIAADPVDPIGAGNMLRCGHERLEPLVAHHMPARVVALFEPDDVEHRQTQPFAARAGRRSSPRDARETPDGCPHR